tara:strand:+ start:1149 stop:2126 length:978 start_codon:yes stop_codon:yes gene_type:complete
MNICLLLITYERKRYLNDIFSIFKLLELPAFVYQNLSFKDSYNHKKVKNLIKKNLKHNNKLKYFAPPEHLDVGSSITYAISHVSKKFKYVLIVEDDININLLKKDILKECIFLLDSSESLASISLYSPYKKINSKEKELFFIKSNYAHSWGWVLKSSCWKGFNHKTSIKPKLEFNQTNGYHYGFLKYGFSSLASIASKGIIKTWDYQWNVFCNDRKFFHYKIFPSLSYHLGDFDEFANNIKNTSPINNLNLKSNLNQYKKFKDFKILNYEFLLDKDLLLHHHDLTLKKIIAISFLNFLPTRLAKCTFKFLSLINRYLLKSKLFKI